MQLGEGTKILVTGVTGFLGGAVAASLLASGRSVVTIARAPDRDHARSRVAHGLLPYFGQRSHSAAKAVSIIVGDLTSDATYADPRLGEVTHVIHSAACTSFASRRGVWASNVEGTKRLAEALQRSARVQRFLHVSTAYCCGDRPNRVVREEDAPHAEHGHVNEYTRSKAAAELLLRSMDLGERLLIARPSVVIGHTRLGVEPSSSLYWYCRALAALRCGPYELTDRRDIVPVDYVAEALLFLLQLERPRFDTYHVSAGSLASQTLGELVRKLGGAPEGDLLWRKIPADTFSDLRDEVRPLVRDEREARKLILALSACAKFGELGIDYFENERLLGEGFPPPPRFLDYLDVCRETSGDASIFDQLVDDA